jgi:AcrR family transcriptional regulator
MSVRMRLAPIQRDQLASLRFNSYPHVMTSDMAQPSPPRTRRTPPPELDGRMERSRVTRQKIVAALLDLIRAGNLGPTAEDVAQYASVGDRTVFRHFQDMEALFAEMNDKVRALVQPMLTETYDEGPLAQRIEQLVSARAATFDQITAYYLSGEIRLHSSPTLQRARVQFAAQQRRQLLACLPEVEARPEVAAAIEMLTSMEGWLRLRRTQGLSAKQSKMAIVVAVATL